MFSSFSSRDSTELNDLTNSVTRSLMYILHPQVQNSLYLFYKGIMKVYYVFSMLYLLTFQGMRN